MMATVVGWSPSRGYEHYARKLRTRAVMSWVGCPL